MKTRVLRNSISIFVLGGLVILTPSLGQNIEDEPFVLLTEKTSHHVGPIYKHTEKKTNFMLTVEFVSKDNDELLKQILKVKDKNLLKGLIEIYQNDRLIEKRDLANISSKLVLYTIPKSLNLRFYFSLEQQGSVKVKTLLFIRESLVNKIGSLPFFVGRRII